MKDFHKLIQWSVIVRNGTNLDVVVCQDAFIEKAQNFSLILSNSETAHEFAEALPRHACDKHEWDGSACFMH